MSNEVLTFSATELNDLKIYLKEQLLSSTANSNSIIFRNEAVVISIYKSGKVLFQGKEAKEWYDKISVYFNKKTSQEDNKTASDEQQTSKTLPRIGTDESGKGDFFGPLVTAGFFLYSKEDENTLRDLGVTDSKKISNNKIINLASEIKKIGAHSIVKIGPKKYNELYSNIKNVNNLLGWSHARAIENILDGHESKLAVADKFGDEKVIENALLKKGKKIQLVQFHKAESDIAVAAASILARATFLEEIKRIEKDLNIKIPLGSGKSVVDTGVAIGRESGIKSLEKVAKIHFKTYKNIIDLIN
ncbi:ribonuclease HIII [Niallia sp.]|uniref:ribonuclease HIII n=1 Tax=Niallia sp. TaxID=2837523 RepID=UPI00289B40BA|nr:ribonuclease HIII [Niallia sp.]